MAKTDLDAVAAGMQSPRTFMKLTGTMEAAGVFHSLFYTAGLPGAAVAPTPGLAGAALTSYAGQLPWTDPGSGTTELAGLKATAGVAGTLLLCDRLWHNSGFTVTTTTAQAVNSATWPARDANGATTGEGVLIGIEVSTATTNAGAIANMTLDYDDTAGASSTGTTAYNFPATAAAGTFVPFLLAAGDTGVQQVNSLTLGTSLATGNVHLVAYRILDQIEVPTANIGGLPHDAITCGLAPMYNGTVPFLIWLPTATTTTVVTGSVVWTQG